MKPLHGLMFFAVCAIVGAAIPLGGDADARSSAAPAVPSPAARNAAKGALCAGGLTSALQISLKPVGLISDPAGDSMKLSLETTSMYAAGSNATFAFEILDAKGGAVVKPTLTSASFTKAGAAFTQALLIPAGLNDGYYLARVQAVAVPATAGESEGDTSVLDGVHFRIEGGKIELLEMDDWLGNSHGREDTQ